MKTLSCFNKPCENKWQEKLGYAYRVQKCPQHHDSIAICGAGTPSLCSACTNQGYYVASEGGGWFPKFTVKKK